MISYYAFRPRADGTEPLGTTGRMLFELKTDNGAIRRARRVLGPSACVFRYRNFYNDATFTRVNPEGFKCTTTT